MGFTHDGFDYILLQALAIQHQFFSLELKFTRNDRLWRIVPVEAGDHVQWVATLLVPAQTGHHHGTNITPSTLIDGFMHVDVLRLLFAVLRSVGRKANAFRCRPDVPAFIRESDIDLCPELGVLVFVVGMQVVDVKPADVTQDFLRAFIAPVVGGVTDDVVMGAWEPPVVTKVIELCFR